MLSLKRVQARNSDPLRGYSIWSRGSVGLWRVCTPIAKAPRNSTSIAWGSGVSLRECGALFDTPANCATLSRRCFLAIFSLFLILSRDRWHCVNSTFGVASLIMGVEQPIPVPQGIVETLLAATESSGTVRLDSDLEIGQKVRILSGPFAETLCQLVHLDDRGRVRVLLEFMGTEVSARLDRSCVAPAA